MYDFNYLMNAANQKKSIGKWKGTAVYPISRNDFKFQFGNLDSNFYLIYDDNNYLVKDNTVYGYMSVNGDITQCRHYEYFKTPRAAEPVKPVVEVKSAADEEAVAAEISISGIIEDVDKLLKLACSWKDEACG